MKLRHKSKEIICSTGYLSITILKNNESVTHKPACSITLPENYNSFFFSDFRNFMDKQFTNLPLIIEDCQGTLSALKEIQVVTYKKIVKHANLIPKLFSFYFTKYISLQYEIASSYNKEVYINPLIRL